MSRAENQQTQPTYDARTHWWGREGGGQVLSPLGQPCSPKELGSRIFLAFKTFAQKVCYIDFFLKVSPLEDDELVMLGHQLHFGENMPRRTPKSE